MKDHSAGLSHNCGCSLLAESLAAPRELKAFKLSACQAPAGRDGKRNFLAEPALQWQAMTLLVLPIPLRSPPLRLLLMRSPICCRAGHAPSVTPQP